MISHEDIFRTGIALLAFVVAFYAVIARERKTPYILNSIYTITFLVLIALLLSLVSKVIEPAVPVTIASLPVASNAPPALPSQQTNALAGVNTVPLPVTSPAPARVRVATVLNWLSVGMLGFGIVFIFYRVWRIQNRQVNFRNDQLLLTIPMVVRYRKYRQRVRRQKAYEHNAQNLSPKLIESLKKSAVFPAGTLERAMKHNGHGSETEFSTSVAILVSTHMDADNVMCELATRFLDQECYVQYTTCSRHPIEFLLQLKRAWLSQHEGGDWKTVKDRVVLVDGYTPHFGFTDTVYAEWSNSAMEDCLDCIVSPPTYAGIHTAIANAFNKVKKVSGKPKLRAPQLIIYENTHALVDLESSEQYRIFIRHVIPSERLWGGMLTLFVESSVSEENLAVLKEVTHICVDNRDKPASPAAATA
jgi:hypothetical protein